MWGPVSLHTLYAVEEHNSVVSLHINHCLLFTMIRDGSTVVTGILSTEINATEVRIGAQTWDNFRTGTSKSNFQNNSEWSQK
jgi:hypothetical protein